MAALAAIAAVLACVGVYGVLAYSVAQRTREFGIRMALGARGGQVLRTVLGQGLVQTIAGLALGAAGAAALTRYLESLLFGVTSSDARVFALVTLVFGLVALLAIYIPARRATKIDPLLALRVE